MSRAPYLHPSQRNLKNDQVGPSSHQNEYHVGVLQGNWVEERVVYNQRPQNVKLDCLTVSRASYQNHGPGVEKAVPVSQHETSRHLLFGHGTDLTQTDFSTTSSIAYTHTSCPDTIPQSNSLLAKKRAQWVVENDPEQDHYKSTKKESHDATADYIRRTAKRV
eukprot:TRINITY_DN33793_c0_g1_i1.p1 TRINITY_DN33793_c0_g1~~TRINITY_DN33793_c0_g1_i1.p1  ORF type:complete len:178 (+),score=26.54 TRINITY_DN33793_c0_g1_i1:47-535(+)